MLTETLAAFVGGGLAIFSSYLTKLMEKKDRESRQQYELSIRTFDRLRELYRDYIHANTKYFLDFKPEMTSDDPAFKMLSIHHAEIQITAPEAIIKAAEKVHDIIKKMSAFKKEKEQFSDSWHEAMEDLITELRKDIMKFSKRE